MFADNTSEYLNGDDVAMNDMDTDIGCKGIDDGHFDEPDECSDEDIVVLPTTLAHIMGSPRRQPPVRRKAPHIPRTPMTLKCLMGDQMEEEKQVLALRSEKKYGSTAEHDIGEMMEWSPNQLWCLLVDEALGAMLDQEERRRVRTKRCDWRIHLKTAVSTRQFAVPGGVRSEVRRKGRDVYTKVMSKFSGKSWRECSKATRDHFLTTFSEDQKSLWGVLGAACDECAAIQSFLGSSKKTPYTEGNPTQSQTTQHLDTTAGDIFENVAGVMMTYNTTLGMKDAIVLTLLQEEATDEVFVAALKQSKFHQEQFRLFKNWVEQLAAEMKMASYAVSMEFSPAAEERGRVHFHAYMGSDVRGGPGFHGGRKRFTVSLKDLHYCGIKPVARPTILTRWHPVSVFNAVVNGLYYVGCDKIGGIFRFTNVEPIKVAR